MTDASTRHSTPSGDVVRLPPISDNRLTELRELVKVGPGGRMMGAWDDDPRARALTKALADALVAHDRLLEQLEAARGGLEDQAGEFGNERHEWESKLNARTRDFLAAVERNEEKDREIAVLKEQLEEARAIIQWVADYRPVSELWQRQEDVDRVRAFLDSNPAKREPK